MLWIPFAMDAVLHPENNLLKNPDSYQVKLKPEVEQEIGLRWWRDVLIRNQAKAIP